MQMRVFCGRLKISTDQKKVLSHQLEYFRIQALCDHDRRDDDTKINERWIRFKSSAKGTGLLEHFIQLRPVWDPVAIFVGEKQLSTVTAAVVKKHVEKNEAVKNGATTTSAQSIVSVNGESTWDAKAFFRKLYAKIASATFEDRKDAVIVRFGLRLLIFEAQRLRSKRDHKRNKETWLLIWPLLKAHGFLDEFQSDLRLKDQLRFFFQNKV